MSTAPAEVTVHTPVATRQGTRAHRAGHSWDVRCSCGTWMGTVDTKSQAAYLTCSRAAS